MNRQSKTELELYNRISENADMGADALRTLLPKVKNHDLRELIAEQQSAYLNYSARAAAELAKSGRSPAAKGPIQKLPAKLGINMNLCLDGSASKVAEMVISGSDMGIIDLTKAMNRLEAGASKEAESLGREVIEFEERNISNMKKFL